MPNPIWQANGFGMAGNWFLLLFFFICFYIFYIFVFPSVVFVFSAEKHEDIKVVLDLFVLGFCFPTCPSIFVVQVLVFFFAEWPCKLLVFSCLSLGLCQQPLHVFFVFVVLAFVFVKGPCIFSGLAICLDQFWSFVVFDIEETQVLKAKTI